MPVPEGDRQVARTNVRTSCREEQETLS